MFKTIAAITSLLLALTAPATHAQECRDVATVEKFNINTYTSAPWYVHQQAENAYSPIENNYCVRANYTLLDEPTTWGYTVGVNNKAQNVHGTPFEGNLCAYQTDEYSLSKLAVAPCFLPKFFAGPYWVVAYNETEGYALISGGQPTIVTNTTEDGNVLCSSGDGINNSGLWIFSRSQTRDEALVSKVRGIAQDAGFDLSVLNDVVQENCDACTDSEELRDEDDGETICDWVDARFTRWRCFWFGDICPETCGRCGDE